MLTDLTRAARSLLRVPAYTTITVLSLAFGISATTIMGTVLDVMLIRMPNLPEIDRLPEVRIGPMKATPSAKLLVAWRKTARAVERIEFYGFVSVPSVTFGDLRREE